jgi:hypothetical protein
LLISGYGIDRIAIASGAWPARDASGAWPARDASGPGRPAMARLAGRTYRA